MASKFNLRMSVIGGEFEGTLKTLAQNVTHKTAHSVAQEVVRVAVENLINPRGSGRMTGLSSGGDPNKKGYPHVDTGALLESFHIQEVHNGWRVVVTDPKARQLNDGVGPGYYVSQKDLQAWAMRKFPNMAKDPKKLRHFVITVQRRINKNGLRPTFFFTNAVREVSEKVRRGVRLMPAERAKGVVAQRQFAGYNQYVMKMGNFVRPRRSRG